MFMNKYIILEMQLTEKVNKNSSITNWKITQKDELIASKKKKTKNGTVPWVVPTFTCKWLHFPQACVMFTWTSMNILQFIYASHHQGVASKKWLRISTFWHSITIFLFYLHFSCDYTWEVELCLKTRTCSYTEQLRSIKMMLCLMSMMSQTQEAESPVVTVTVVHNILKWEICRSDTMCNMQCYCTI